MDTINQAAIESTESTYWIDQAQALERLYRNADFKEVIVKGYFEKKAVDGVSLLANDQIKRSGTRTDLMESLIAISSLKDHFNTIENLGAISVSDIEEEIEA